MISSTRTSGAEAPAVMPRRSMPVNSSQTISAAPSTSMARGQPAFIATSTRRIEFELLGEPTTIRRSQEAAMLFTASWRLVVA